MPTRNVNLTKRFDNLIERNVASGRYGNASEVVREGLRLLEKQEKEEAAWESYVLKEAQARPSIRR
jgi:antitoxin ParD1/3/4